MTAPPEFDAVAANLARRMLPVAPVGVEWLPAGIPDVLTAADLGTARGKLVEELTRGRHDDDIAVVHVRHRGEDGT